MCQVLVTCISVPHSEYVLDPNLFGSLGFGGDVGRQRQQRQFGICLLLCFLPSLQGGELKFCLQPGTKILNVVYNYSCG